MGSDPFSPDPTPVAAAMPLALLVPDLLLPAGAPGAMRRARLPALEKWLARADASREPGAGDAWLLRQFGMGPEAPVAALTLAADGGPRAGEWLRADPVHQRVERDALVLHDASVLGLTRGEADEALAALNAFFAADGLAFVGPAPDRWYVRVPEGELPKTVPLAEAAGRNPFGMLPEGGTRLKWRSLFSEAQMLLAGLALNAAREAQGRPALNALWFWGGGRYPETLPAPFASVAANDDLARSLALASGCAARPLPPAIGELATHGTRRCLAVLDGLRAPFRRGDAEAWLAAARDLERGWFDALGEALAAFGGIRVVLPAGRETAVFDLSPRSRWRFLRRPRPLGEHA